jgi:hypothetical protein
MRINGLGRRIRALERARGELEPGCVCRGGGETRYHTANELLAIMKMRCPAHEFRDLGRLTWWPSSLPLRAEDVELCSCPSSPVREFLEGRRISLSDAELQGADRIWQQTYGPESDQTWMLERKCIDHLLRQYELKKRLRGGKNG